MNTFTAAGSPAFVASAEYFAQLGIAPIAPLVLVTAG